MRRRHWLAIGVLGLAWHAGPSRADDVLDATDRQAATARSEERSPIYLDAARRERSRNLERAGQLAAKALASASGEVQRFDAESALAEISLLSTDAERTKPHVAMLERLVATPAFAAREAEMLLLRGRLAMLERDNEGAERDLARAIELARTRGDRQNEARALHSRGQLLIRLGRQPEAETMLQRALGLNLADGREREADANRHYLGFIARDQGAYERAMALHLEVLQHAEARHEPQGVAHSANALGIVYSQRGQLEDSVRYFQRARLAYAEMDDRYGAAMAAINVGNAYNMDKRWAEALPSLQDALALVAAIDNADAEILARSEYAATLAGLDRLDEAERSAQRAMTLAADASVVRRQQAVGAMAQVRRAQHRPAEAAQLWRTALELGRQTQRKPDIAETLADLAEVERDAGQLEQAYAHEHEARVLGEELKKEQLSQQLLEISARYEAGKRDAELAAQKQRIVDLEDAARQQQRVRILLAVALVSAFLLVLSLASRARAKARAEVALREKQSIVEQANRDLAEAAETDPLTGVRNRRHFQRAVQPNLVMAIAAGTPFALVLINADRFKSINDRYGHDVGDAALRAIVAAWRGVLDESATLLRWGGEEFLLVLPGCDATATRALVARGLAATRAATIGVGDARMPLAVSAGWIVAPCPGARVDDLIRLADLALLAAKRRGRDRGYGIVVARLPGLDLAILSSIDDVPAEAVDVAA